MTYKELILKLLQNREELVCLEDHLMDDFKENKTSGKSFNDWCNTNKIVCKRIQDSGPPRIQIKKVDVAMKHN
ncbi:MAG TPA: hypothetical protein VLH61_06145 [Bacteroidales bacterium]|nr:hypothetical protein [Bacteroidales bacterium]